MRWTTVNEEGFVRHRKVLRDSPCGKGAYRSKKLAKEIAGQQTRRHRVEMHAYRCTEGCHAWHIGRVTRSRGQANHAA